MKTFLFLTIYFLSLAVEISFLPYFFSLVPPLSFWAFVLGVFFLDDKKVMFFGGIAGALAAVFFSRLPLFFLFMSVAAAAFLIKSVNGLGKKTAVVLETFFAVLFYELMEIALFYRFDGFSRFIAGNLFFNIGFLGAILVFVLLVEMKKSWFGIYKLS